MNSPPQVDDGRSLAVPAAPRAHAATPGGSGTGALPDQRAGLARGRQGQPQPTTEHHRVRAPGQHAGPGRQHPHQRLPGHPHAGRVPRVLRLPGRRQRALRAALGHRAGGPAPHGGSACLRTRAGWGTVSDRVCAQAADATVTLDRCFTCRSSRPATPCGACGLAMFCSRACEDAGFVKHGGMCGVLRRAQDKLVIQRLEERAAALEERVEELEAAVSPSWTGNPAASTPSTKRTRRPRAGPACARPPAPPAPASPA